MDYLVHGVAKVKQLLAMCSGTDADLGQGLRITTRWPGNPNSKLSLVIFLGRQRARELTQERRHAIGQLFVCCRSVRALSNFLFATSN